jgi:hypothetical protein
MSAISAATPGKLLAAMAIQSRCGDGSVGVVGVVGDDMHL